MPSATWRTSTACGFSNGASVVDGAKASATVSGLGTDTWMPDAPTTIRMPTATSDIGTVRTRRPPSRGSHDEAAVHLGVLHVVPRAVEAHAVSRFVVE